MNILAIIQARMGSTRLPGKVMQDIGGATMLARVVNRTRRARLVNEVVVATSTSEKDEALVGECERLGVRLFRGSEEDVLDRYHGAARAFGAEVVVRITSDCPLIDPELIDRTITAFQQQNADYTSNALERTWPRGLDTEVFKAEALKRAWEEAKEPYQRAHVTPYLYQHPEWFRIVPFKGETDYSGYRWTVDTPADLALVREIYARLGNRDTFSWREALAVMEADPALAEINREILQKPLEQG